MPLVGGFGCLKLCLYGIRELAKQIYDFNQSQHCISMITTNESSSFLQTLAPSLQLLHYRGGQRRISQEEESQPCQEGLEGDLQEMKQNIFSFQIFSNGADQICGEQ